MLQQWRNIRNHFFHLFVFYRLSHLPSTFTLPYRWSANSGFWGKSSIFRPFILILHYILLYILYYILHYILHSSFSFFFCLLFFHQSRRDMLTISFCYMNSSKFTEERLTLCVRRTANGLVMRYHNHHHHHHHHY